MARGYDGSIRIDSSIDPKGFNKGVSDLRKSAVKAAGAIGRTISEGVLTAALAVTAALHVAATVLTGLVTAVGGLGVVIVASIREFYKLDGSVQGLKDSVQDLRNAFAIAFAPLVEFAVPYIQTVISWLIKMFNTVAMIVGALLGQTQVWQAVEGGAAKAAAATGKVAKNTEKAKKAAKGALAAFDEINVLQKPDEATPASSGGGAIPGAGALQSAAFELVPVTEEIKNRIEELKQAFFEFFAPVGEAFDRFMEKTQPLWDTLGGILLWVWENILVPLGDWLVQQAAPAFLDLLGASLVILNDVLVGLRPLGEWLWENFLQPLAEWTGNAIISAMEWLTARLEDLHEWIGENEKAWQTIVTVMAIAAGVLIALALGPITAIIAVIIGLIAILKEGGKAWETLKSLASQAWTIIKAVWQIAADWFRTHVINPISDGFTKMLDNLKKGWRLAFTGIKLFVKSTINTIIDFINGMIRAVASGINAVIGSLNSISVKVPDWIPGVGGNSFGLNIAKVSAPQIPRLATGAVIPPNAEFAAILGDQRSGRNLEAPEGLIRQIIQEEIGNIQIETSLGFKGNLAGLVRELKPYIDREDVRIGGSLVKSGGNAR